nr:ATP-binding cassette domain-containing protein [Spirochaeta sp.]
MERTILELKNVSKYFPGIKALDGVDFKIRTGEVHALIGENGAGKSTLVKILTGIHQPRTGSIILDGKEVEFKTPLISQAAGIAAIHQEATMFPELTVTENIYMGHHLGKSPFGILDWRQMKKSTKGLLENLELAIQPDALVKNLSVAQRHMVEIVKALSMDARIVIMDEPTSSLSLKEIEHLYKIIRRLKAEERAIVFISHKFEDIYEIADSFTVFRDGKKSGEGVVAATELDDIVNMMVGRSIKHMFPKSDVEIGKEILKVENLSRTGIFKDVSFVLHRGEILGFFGLVGAGRSEVMQTIFGIEQGTGGRVSLKGRDIHISTPQDAINSGMVYIP